MGLCCGAGLRLAVYLWQKRKKYRHGMEYGLLRWGTWDIEPFMAPKFADNIILTKNGTVDDVQPSTGPQECPEQERAGGAVPALAKRDFG